jgi:butyrate kinase
LPAVDFKVLAINPGSTSTKFAVYVNEKPEFVKNVRHSEEEMDQFRGRPVLDQKDFRLSMVEREFHEAGYKSEQLSAVAGRGGLLPRLISGTYRVNAKMLADLREAKQGQHASNLGAVLAHALASRAGLEAYIVDPVSVDERPDRSRLSGSALIQRPSLSHMLNPKAIAKRYAREKGAPYKDLRLIVVHMGSGICVTAHEGGKTIEYNDSRDEGPFATERAGSLPCGEVIKMCFSGKYTQHEVENLLLREAGLYSYLGTKDLAKIEERMEAGDAKAKLVFDTMAYQIGQQTGAMGAVLQGRVDAVLLTGGMAHSTRLIAELRPYVEWIAPTLVYPGEDELLALTEGVMRVLRQEEPAIEYTGEYLGG